MASLFGTNNIFSTFSKVYPAPCEKTGVTLRDKVMSCIMNDNVCKNPECYTKSIELLEYAEMFNNMPVTYFIFDNGAYDIFYKDITESDKRKITRAHLVLGDLVYDALKDKINRITTSARKSFFFDGKRDVIFHMENNYPIVQANVLQKARTENITIYFVDMPLFSLEQLYIDTSSV
jgi:hypothetical protein